MKDLDTPRARSKEASCELFAALMKLPRTKKDLVEMTGVSLSGVESWLREMNESGLLYSEDLPSMARPAKLWHLRSTPYVDREPPVQPANRRVYLAGPMTGLPELNYPAFNAAATDLRFRGWWVENPAALELPPCDNWRDYMRRGIGQMLSCDWVALLPGWERSRGARIEERLARDLGLRVVTVEQMKAQTCPERGAVEDPPQWLPPSKFAEWDRTMAAQQAEQKPRYKDFAEHLLAMIGRISDALGISAEEQQCANGDLEILAAIAQLKAMNSGGAVS